MRQYSLQLIMAFMLMSVNKSMHFGAEIGMMACQLSGKIKPYFQYIILHLFRIQCVQDMSILVQFIYYYSNSRISSALSICNLFFFYELFGNIYMEQDTVSRVVKYYSQSRQSSNDINFNELLGKKYFLHFQCPFLWFRKVSASPHPWILYIITAMDHNGSYCWICCSYMCSI